MEITEVCLMNELEHMPVDAIPTHPGSYMQGQEIAAVG